MIKSHLRGLKKSAVTMEISPKLKYSVAKAYQTMLTKKQTADKNSPHVQLKLYLAEDKKAASRLSAPPVSVLSPSLLAKSTPPISVLSPSLPAKSTTPISVLSPSLPAESTPLVSVPSPSFKNTFSRKRKTSSAGVLMLVQC